MENAICGGSAIYANIKINSDCKLIHELNKLFAEYHFEIAAISLTLNILIIYRSSSNGYFQTFMEKLTTFLENISIINQKSFLESSANI